MPELPDWQPIDEVGGTDSDDVEAGRVVAVVASEGAVAAGWAEHAALTLARSWSEAGHKVMLVDGALDHPSLHELTGVPNGEGLSDATLYGASVGRVARQVEDGSYFLIPAGTAVADANAVVRSPRWDRLARGFVEAGVTLAVYVRDGESGATAFLGSASEIVVLSAPGESAPGVVRDLEPLVRAVTGFGKAGASPARGEEEPARARPVRDAPVPVRSRLSLLILLLVLLTIVVLGALGILPIPGISPLAAAPAAAPDPTSLLTG